MNICARISTVVCTGLLLAGASARASAQANAPAEKVDPATLTAPLGSPKYLPSVERPIGWRGDGSGRYPGATPPKTWGRVRSGGGYTATNIQWATPLPNVGVSCPILVGQRIFLTSEVNDLICIDKLTGKVAWIRSNEEFEGLSDEEKKANPAFAQLESLLPQLTKANEDAVAAINAAGDAGSAGYKQIGALAKKREIEKKISDGQMAIDKKKFDRYWAQAVFGFAGPTVTSDGKHVCAFFTTGVTACYDLDGNRKWIAKGAGGGSEHGNFASPVLCGNRVVVWANELRGYDVEKGTLAFTNPAKGNNTYGSCFKVQVGADWVAGFQFGYFTRVRDGVAVWDQGIFGDSVSTPIIENGQIFAFTGYPKFNDKNGGLKAYKLPASAENGKLTLATTFKMDWADDELVKDKAHPFDRGFTASPLLVDGLMYNVTEGGGLIVSDAATGNLIYKKVLPMKPKTEYWNWAGTSASPTLAGKLIYLMDNQGTTFVIEPGPVYKEVAKNTIEESKDGKSQEQNVSTPVFEGTRMYYRTPNYLYCIGEK